MEILAGLVSGLVMGLLFLGAIIIAFILNPRLPEHFAKRLPPHIPPMLVMLLIVMGVPPFWGIVGVIAGLLFKVFQDSFPGSGLGSSNLVFTLVALSFSVLLTIIGMVIRRHWLPIMLCLAFAGVFGWVLPLLAT